MRTYKEYLESIPKEELVKMIMGDHNTAPVQLAKEPKYSRPQIIWALSKMYRNKPFRAIEHDVEEMINLISGFKWDKVYPYDWIRFDVRKPGFYWFILVLLFALYGVIHIIYTAFEWIFK